MNLIDQFHAWAEAHELDFPCTATAYTARVSAFLHSERGLDGRWNQNDYDALMQAGIGPDWQERS